MQCSCVKRCMEIPFLMDMHVNTHQTDDIHNTAVHALHWISACIPWTDRQLCVSKAKWGIGQSDSGGGRWDCLLIFVYVCLGITGWRTRGRSHRGLWGSGGRASVEIMEWGNRPVRRTKNTTSRYSWECINYVWLQFSFGVKRGGELARSKSLCIFLLFICTSTVALHIL